MHRLFLGCNLWALVFLTGALAVRGENHVRVAIFAAVFACLVQSGVIALFLGAAKLTKEHVGRFDMPLSLIDRVNQVYHRLFPIAAVGASLTALAAITGGLADVGRAPVWAHLAPAIAAYLYLLAAAPLEFVLQRRMHAVILDVEKHLPPPDRDATPHPGYRPDRVVWDRRGRARALLYVGLTLPLPYLGYTFISGREVSFLLLPSVALTALCLGAAAHLMRSPS